MSMVITTRHDRITRGQGLAWVRGGVVCGGGLVIVGLMLSIVWRSTSVGFESRWVPSAVGLIEQPELANGSGSGDLASGDSDAGDSDAGDLGAGNAAGVPLAASVSPDDDFEPMYQGWEQPDLVLFITGRQHGYIEPCGCSGLDRAKGGLLRRHAVIQDMEKRGWPVIKLDLGDQIRRTGPQAVVKLQSTLEALRGIMEYDAIGLGAGELRLDGFELLSLLMNTAAPTEVQSPVVSANATVFDDESVRPYLVVEKNGRRVGITSVVSPRHFQGLGDLTSDERETKIFDPAVGLSRVVPKLVAEKCDAMVLLAYVSERESRDLAEKFPQFDFIVNEGVDGEPVDYLEPIQVGDRVVSLVQMGYKSMFAGAIAIYNDKSKPVQYQKITLNHRFSDTDAMKANFQRYQAELQRKTLERLISKPSRHPSGYEYVGSQVCADCHDSQYEVWAEGTDAWKASHPGQPGPHSRATRDLVEPGERTWVQRHHDPECLSCHVTGWNPQQYFAYQTGYLSLEKDVSLHGSGCENCHGPGSRHVALENGEEPAPGERDLVLSKLRVSKEEAKERLCVECHDLDNSPDFDFEKYWPYIEH
jgi:hypothetical protein